MFWGQGFFTNRNWKLATSKHNSLVLLISILFFNNRRFFWFLYLLTNDTNSTRLEAMLFQRISIQSLTLARLLADDEFYCGLRGLFAGADNLSLASMGMLPHGPVQRSDISSSPGRPCAWFRICSHWHCLSLAFYHPRKYEHFHGHRGREAGRCCNEGLARCKP